MIGATLVVARRAQKAKEDCMQTTFYRFLNTGIQDTALNMAIDEAILLHLARLPLVTAFNYAGSFPEH
jgi:hypothetical protein